MRARGTLVLAGCWTASWAVFKVLPEPAAQRLLHDASTTLPRVTSWPWTLPVSGLLVQDELPVWLLALLLGAAPLERAVGTRRALLLLGGVHGGATALSQGLLGLRVHLGDAPHALLTQPDVGPSYLAVAGLAGAAAVGRTPWSRLLPFVALLAGLPELLEGLAGADLAATGHLAAVVLGLGGGAVLHRRACGPGPRA
ncbi:MAG: hypothetical protein JWN17_2226 [Frankiales bacterium]|nr:hypothetical protein [Frankiales bacterium]